MRTSPCPRYPHSRYAGGENNRILLEKLIENSLHVVVHDFKMGIFERGPGSGVGCGYFGKYSSSLEPCVCGAGVSRVEKPQDMRRDLETGVMSEDGWLMSISVCLCVSEEKVNLKSNVSMAFAASEPDTC